MSEMIYKYIIQQETAVNDGPIALPFLPIYQFSNKNPTFTAEKSYTSHDLHRAYILHTFTPFIIMTRMHV